MKKLLLLPFLLLAVLSMVACGGSDNEPFTPGQPETPEQPGGGDDTDDSDTLAPEGSGRYLVLYSSRTSNTERMARQIRTALDCDMIEVEPQMPYENDYNAMLERAQEELAAIEQGRYPAVGTSVDSFDGYDIVFVGYPIWYGSMATPMQAFLHEHASKLAGRRIALFATSGGSGISASIGEARSLCPEATFVDRTLLLTSSTLSQMEGRVAEWLDEIGAGNTRTIAGYIHDMVKSDMVELETEDTYTDITIRCWRKSVRRSQMSIVRRLRHAAKTCWIRTNDMFRPCSISAEHAE